MERASPLLSDPSIAVSACAQQALADHTIACIDPVAVGFQFEGCPSLNALGELLLSLLLGTVGAVALRRLDWATDDGARRLPTEPVYTSPSFWRTHMASKATVYKAELTVSDMDRHYYATHALTLAQHPSETEERVMVRLLAFALHAHERLEFGRGLSTDDEPDLWRKSLTGEIEQWISLGQPDEARIRKACGRAREVVLIGYSGRSFAIWWAKIAPALGRCENLRVLELPEGSAASLATLIARSMRLQCLIQDGEVQLMSDMQSVAVTPALRA